MMICQQSSEINVYDKCWFKQLGPNNSEYCPCDYGDDNWCVKSQVASILFRHIVYFLKSCGESSLFFVE